MAMDRSEARRLLGVSPGASARQVESAFRKRVHASHPDRYPPGSEAAEDATVVMQQLTDARRVLRGESRRTQEAGVTGSPAEHGAAYVTRQHAPGASERFRSAADIDRLARSWGLWWGSFLVVAAIGSFIIGSRSATNDAVPIWSPALALIGLVSLVIGWRAHRRLR